MTSSDSKRGELYSTSEITEKLQHQLPAWRLHDGAICRSYRTGGWRATLMLANAAAHLAEAAFHHPELRLSYARLEILLSTHSAGGVTDKDFELALKLEELLTWQPDKGALTGIPDDPGFDYLIDD